MKCQYPITHNIAPKCKNKAEYKDADGRVYCGSHGTRGMVRLSAQHSMQSDALPQCEKCGSSFLWSNDGPAVCCNPECGNRR